MKASGDLHSSLSSSTGVYKTASVGSLSNLQFVYYENLYNYNIPLEMNNEVVGTMLDDRYYSGSADYPYNVRLSFPSSLLGTRITGTWHIPLSIYSRYTFYYYDSYDADLHDFPAATMDQLATDFTYRSSVSVSDNSFPSGVSVSLTDRSAGNSDWVDLVVSFDDYLLPSNFYANYFSFDLTFHTDFQVFVSSLEDLVPEELRQLSASTCEANLTVRSSAYSSSDIVLTLPQIGNATNSQLYYDVLAAINNANISYDITVDGTDVSVDIDTSSLAQQTTVANILTVLNNIKSDSASIPALSSNFSTFATAALTYLGNIGADSSTISSILSKIIEIDDDLGILSSELARIYSLFDISNSFDTVSTTSSSFISSDLPLSSLVSYFVFQSGSGDPTISNIRDFSTGTSFSVTLTSSSNDSKTYSVSFPSTVGGAYDLVNGSGYKFTVHTFTSVTSVTSTSTGVYYWRLPSFMPYSSSQRTSYICNMGIGSSGLSVGHLNSLQSIIRFVPTDQTLNTKALADTFLSSHPLQIICWEEIGDHVTFIGTNILPFGGSNVLSSSAFQYNVTYLTSNLYTYNNMSSLLAALTAGFTGITSNSSLSLDSISQNTFNRWVSIIQQVISTQLNTGSGDLSIEASLAASDVDYLHSQIETPLWEDVASKLDDIEDFLGTVPSGVPTAAVWFVGLIEDVWDALGPFGYVLGTSLVVGFIVILFGVINHFPRGSTSDDSMAHRYDSDSGT